MPYATYGPRSIREMYLQYIHSYSIHTRVLVYDKYTMSPIHPVRTCENYVYRPLRLLFYTQPHIQRPLFIWQNDKRHFCKIVMKYNTLCVAHEHNGPPSDSALASRWAPDIDLKTASASFSLSTRIYICIYIYLSWGLFSFIRGEERKKKGYICDSVRRIYDAIRPCPVIVHMMPIFGCLDNLTI